MQSSTDILDAILDSFREPVLAEPSPRVTQILPAAPADLLPPPPSRAEAASSMPGYTLGAYRVVRRIGRGRMSDVFLGEHVAIGSHVAIKLLHPHLATDPWMVARFYAEARALGLAAHENIVTVLDTGAAGPNQHYLTMEFLEGRSLASLCASGPVPAGVAVPILAQICEALATGHARGLMHRNLRAENILLIHRAGSPFFVKLLDFGTAALGGEHFVPQLVDGRIDLHALGAVAYQLLTGRSALDDALEQAGRRVSPREANPDVPERLSEVVARALADRPEDRFQDVSQFREALVGALVGEPTLMVWRTQPQPEAAPAAPFTLGEEEDTPPTPMATPIPMASPAPVYTASPAPVAATPVVTPMLMASPAPVAATPVAATPVMTTPVGTPIPGVETTPAVAASPAATEPLASTAPVDATAPVAATGQAPGPQPVGRFVDSFGMELRFRCTEWVRGGLFASGEGAFPPLLARLTLWLPVPGGREVSCEVEVVRHVDAELARLWGTPSGFGAQFRDPTLEFQEAVDRLVRSKSARAPEPTVPRDDVLSEPLLNEVMGRHSSDPYVFLGLPLDVGLPDVWRKGREDRQRLESLRERPLSPAQQEKLAACLKRVQWALGLLGEVEPRLAHDAKIGNFQGVARCIAAGAQPRDLAVQRKRFLAVRRAAETKSMVHALSARTYEAQGKGDRALLHYGLALREDPLNVELQRCYWGLARRHAYAGTEQEWVGR